MKAALLFFASTGLTVLGACNGRVEQVLGAGPGDGGGGTGTPDGGGTSVAEDSGRASPPAVPASGGNDCVTDAECNESPSISQLLGRCWKKPDSPEGPGACLCNEGASIQPSGKCGFTAPSSSCSGAGKSCSSWGSCSGAGNHRAGVAANVACNEASASGEEAVCCVPRSACRETAIPGCYQKGTDAAYSLPCINGWMTCYPGDSPDIDI